VELFSATLKSFMADIAPSIIPVGELGTFHICYSKGLSVRADRVDTNQRRVLLENEGRKLFYDLLPGDSIQSLLQAMEHHNQHGAEGIYEEGDRFNDALAFMDGMDPEQARFPGASRRSSPGDINAEPSAESF
jgi:hypothetical protein